MKTLFDAGRLQMTDAIRLTLDSLAHRDTALEAVCRMPQWSYLRPLLRFRGLYLRLREDRNRLRKPGREWVGGRWVETWRKGPLTLEARREGLAEVLAIQHEVNAAAVAARRPLIDVFDSEEAAYVRECHRAEVWPRGWDGTEPRADTVGPPEGHGLFDAAEMEGEP